MSESVAPRENAEVNVYCGGEVFPGLRLDGNFVLVLFSENALNAEVHGVHVGDVIEVDKDHAIRTISRIHEYQSRFLLAWDDDRPSPVDRVIDTITRYQGRCIGYLAESRVLIVLHDQPLSFPSPPGVLIAASYPHSGRLSPLPDSAPAPLPGPVGP